MGGIKSIKPMTHLYIQSCGQIDERKIRPEEVVYVGDGLHDMRAGLGAGFSFVGVETGLVTASQFKKAGAISVPSVGELLT